MNKPLTREFLLERGYCCDNGCTNCPYKDDSEDNWCHYSGMPSPAAYKTEPITLDNSDWIDSDNDDWDGYSSDRSDGGENYGDDDSSEY